MKLIRVGPIYPWVLSRIWMSKRFTEEKLLQADMHTFLQELHGI